MCGTRKATCCLPSWEQRRRWCWPGRAGFQFLGKQMATEPPRRFQNRRFLHFLAAAYAVVWIITAIRPLDREDWFIENLLVFTAVPVLILTYRRLPLSDASYLLLAIFLALHAVGAHYTYAKVPLGDWMKEALAWDRNHFDRLVHCLFGLLLLVPVREVFMRTAPA